MRLTWLVVVFFVISGNGFAESRADRKFAKEVKFAIEFTKEPCSHPTLEVEPPRKSTKSAVIVELGVVFPKTERDFYYLVQEGHELVLKKREVAGVNSSTDKILARQPNELVLCSSATKR